MQLIYLMQCYGNTGFGVLGKGYKIRKSFWLKINCSEMKSLNFVIWGGVKKCGNLTFKVNILCQKSSESF